MSTIDKYNIRITGKGSRPILFAHGYGCDQHMWRFIYPSFENDYKIILFDYIGAGGSDYSFYDADKYSSLDGYAEDLIEICTYLELKDTILVGHSVSSMICGLAVIRASDYFSKLVMIAPSPRYINDGPYLGGFQEKDIEELLNALERNYLGWATTIAPAIMANGERPELAEELTSSFCRAEPSIAKDFAYATFYADNRRDLQRIGIPTLVLQCREDILAPLTIGEYVAEQIPLGTLTIMHATGHCPNLSAPQETIQCIKEFL